MPSEPDFIKGVLSIDYYFGDCSAGFYNINTGCDWNPEDTSVGGTFANKSTGCGIDRHLYTGFLTAYRHSSVGGKDADCI